MLMVGVPTAATLNVVVAAVPTTALAALYKVAVTV